MHGGERAVRQSHEVSWPPIDEDLRNAVTAALDAGRIGYGPGSASRQFEDDFARRHGMAHAIACNSGTSALLLAYFAAGAVREAGSTAPQVIVPAYGFFATVSPLLHLGVQPVFVDADPEVGTIDVARLEAALTPDTAAVVVTHVAGHPADMPAVLDLTRPRGIPVIEDCSHAHGASLNGRLVGTWGDVAAFSLQTGKLLSGGEGGVLLTGSDRHLVRAAMLGNFRRLHGTGLDAPGGLDETGLGLKLRISPLSAAMAGHYLQRMDELISARRTRLDHLTALISEQAGDWFTPPVTRPGASRGAFYEYPVRLRQPEGGGWLLPFVRAALAAEGCVLPHSNTTAVHHLPIFGRSLRQSFDAVLGRSTDGAGASGREGPSMPCADHLATTTFTLPTFTSEPEELVEQYAQALAKVATHLTQIGVQPA